MIRDKRALQDMLFYMREIEHDTERAQMYMLKAGIQGGTYTARGLQQILGKARRMLDNAKYFMEEPSDVEDN